MMRATCAALMLAVAGGVATAQDYTFELISTEDVSIVNNSENAFFIGNNPSSIAFDGTNVYLGGFANFSDPIAGVAIVQIQDFLLGEGGRSFQAVTGSFEATTNFGGRLTNFRGYSGMDWDDELGLLATIDFGQTLEFDQVRIFQQVPAGTSDPNAIELKALSLQTRGIAGPSWDNGFDGMGFDYDNDGTNDGPVAAVLDGISGPPEEKVGPFGYIPPDTTGADPANFVDIEDLQYAPASDGPVLAGEATSTLWRDIDIHPGNGFMAGRAGNALLLATRAPDNGTSGVVVGAPDNAPFVSGQNVAIIHGLMGMDDAVIWNDRSGTLPGQSFTGSVKMSDFAGNDLGFSVVDANGDPVALPDGVGYYDFAWDEASQTLLILDFSNRQVYVLQKAGAGMNDCPPDFTMDDTLDFFDVQAFLSAFSAMLPEGDYNNDGIFDFFDAQAFLADFAAGCP